MLRHFILTSVLILFSAFHLTLNAQYQDFKTWWNLDISKELSSKLTLGLEASQRFHENSLQYDRSLITGSLEYKLIKDLELEGGYRYILVGIPGGGFSSKYRLHGGISYAMDLGAFDLSLRERVQYGFNDFRVTSAIFEQKTVSRTRIKGSYKIFGTPLKAHLAYEFFILADQVYGLLPVANRGSLGLTYSLKNSNKIDLSYMLEDEINTVAPVMSHILMLTYSIDF